MKKKKPVSLLNLYDIIRIPCPMPTLEGDGSYPTFILGTCYQKTTTFQAQTICNETDNANDYFIGNINGKYKATLTAKKPYQDYQQSFVTQRCKMATESLKWLVLKKNMRKYKFS